MIRNIHCEMRRVEKRSVWNLEKGLLCYKKLLELYRDFPQTFFVYVGGSPLTEILVLHFSVKRKMMYFKPSENLKD